MANILDRCTGARTKRGVGAAGAKVSQQDQVLNKPFTNVVGIATTLEIDIGISFRGSRRYTAENWGQTVGVSWCGVNKVAR